MYLGSLGVDKVVMEKVFSSEMWMQEGRSLREGILTKKEGYIRDCGGSAVSFIFLPNKAHV